MFKEHILDYASRSVFLKESEQDVYGKKISDIVYVFTIRQDMNNHNI